MEEDSFLAFYTGVCIFFLILESNLKHSYKSQLYTMMIRQIKKYVKQLPCIVIPSPDTFKIVETDASNIGMVEF